MLDLDNVSLFQIDLTNRQAKLHSQREFDKLNMGITVEQWVLLKLIQEGQNFSQKELAEKSARDPAAITRTIDILERKQFITREKVLFNRRQYAIKLTKSGNDFIETYMPLVEQLRTQATKGIDQSDLDNMVSTLKKIQENLS